MKSAVPYLLLALMLALGVITTEYVARQARSDVESRDRANVFDELSAVRARLEAEINSTLLLSRGVVAYVASHPDVDRDDFRRFAAEIIAGNPSIRNIALAPDNVIRMVYPVRGNEQAIGLDYRKNAAQWPSVKRAIDLRSSVVAGPVTLVQGGVGLISRTPIFVDDAGIGAGQLQRYWGIASIVVDVPSLFAMAGLTIESRLLEFALRGKDGLGPDGDIILGDPALFSAGAVTLPVSLPNGTWQLAGRMRQTGRGSGEATAVRVAGYSLTILIAGLAFVLIVLLRHNRSMALHDQLTGLANRRQLMATMRRLINNRQADKGAYTIFFIDLNGFKPINDRFGHAAGDFALVEIAKRLRAVTRSGDTVARIGGDEFLIIVPGSADATDTSRIAEKLRSEVGKPIYIFGAEMVIGSSIGWASYPEDAMTPEDLLLLADKRMYVGKPRERALA